MLFYVRQVKICSSFPLRIQSEKHRNQQMRRISKKCATIPRKRPYHLCFFVVFYLFPLCDLGAGLYLYYSGVHPSHALFFHLRIPVKHRQIGAFCVKRTLPAKQKWELFTCVPDENFPRTKIGTIWTYCHAMDYINIKATCFGCDMRAAAHQGFGVPRPEIMNCSEALFFIFALLS